MNKISGTQWGADGKILKKLYVGNIIPIMEYGITAFANGANSKLSKAQNQAARIITGAMPSTPIAQMETLAELQPLEDPDPG
jgi:hypothetical protein